MKSAYQLIIATQTLSLIESPYYRSVRKKALRKLAKIALLVPVILISLVSTTTAAEKLELEFDEQAISFRVEDGGEPGESVGDLVFFDAILFDPGTNNLKGTKNTECEAINQRPDGKFILSCRETITIFGSGTIFAEGKIDQARFERPKFEKLKITGGNGAYEGASGKETITQTRFPDQARVELMVSLP